MTKFNVADLKKIKLANNVEQAVYITKNPNSAYSYMSVYSQIVGTTNENQIDIAKIIDYRDKSVLVTGSSGDQYLSSVFFGSKKETIYDINTLAEFYIFLKIAAIRNLEYDKFIEFILPFINKEKYFNLNTVKQLLSEVPSNIKEFWTLYLEEVDIKSINNFIIFLDTSINSVKNKLPYYNENNYKMLQTLLKKKDFPNYIQADASYFEYSIKDKYDFISLSNIIECNQQPFDDIMEKRLYSDEEWIEYIKNIIYRNLNQNGELMILQTNDWNSKLYEEAGYKKYSISSNNPEQKNSILVLKR